MTGSQKDIFFHKKFVLNSIHPWPFSCQYLVLNQHWFYRYLSFFLYVIVYSLFICLRSFVRFYDRSVLPITVFPISVIQIRRSDKIFFQKLKCFTLIAIASEIHSSKTGDRSKKTWQRTLQYGARVVRFSSIGADNFR